MLIRLLTLLYGLDRLLKLAAVAHFFRQPALLPPATWPSLSLIQPVSRSRHDLRRTLGSRMALRYPGPMQQLLVCDDADSETQQLCHELMAAHPQASVSLLTVAPDGGAIASKLAKM
ncbi:MAG: hypothetical protein MUD01_24940, partial [Chloroflexaceae bacterium]|nr:hypothetical protein [Chloroflexaceae bacterium]